MKRVGKTPLFLLLVALVFVLSVWGPEALTKVQDPKVLREVHLQEEEEAGEGYQYVLNSNERLYLLSACLGSQALPESEQSAWLRDAGAGAEPAYQELGGTYAFVVNHKGPTGQEITGEQIYETCNAGLEAFKEAGILPEQVRKVEDQKYTAVLYSAIDVPEPRNNVAVWKVSLSDDKKNTDKANRLIDAYIDADTGKIYEFYVRTESDWDSIDPDAVLEAWREYLGLAEAEAYEDINPLLETTPYFKKYVFDGMDGGKTVVTVGFYEGINELFLKIT